MLCPVRSSLGPVQILIGWSECSRWYQVVGAGAHDGEVTGTGLVQPEEVKAKRRFYCY